MDDLYYSDEIRSLRLRILELEKENEELRKEASRYLGKWISAQDLASWRQVVMLANNSEEASSKPET